MADISFLSIIICLLWMFQSWMCAADQDGITERRVLVGQRVNLTCQLNSSDFIEWWFIHGSDGNLTITNCTYNQDSEHDQCEPVSTYFAPSYKFHATLHNHTSILSLTGTQNEPNIQCRTGDVVQRNYKLISIDPNYLDPYCTVGLPSRDEDGVLGVALSCGVHSGLGIAFTFEGFGLGIPYTTESSESLITKTLHLNDFNNIHNASCNAYIPGFDITRSCNYPNLVKTRYTTEGNDIIVECDTESDVDWHLFDTNGRKEDIKNRTWTRERGRSLLIRNVSEQDVGKVVVCQPGRDNPNIVTLIFTVIPEISGDISRSDSADLKPFRSGNDPFFVPSLLFLVLWLITTISGVLMGCKKYQKIPTTLVISDDEENQTAPEYDTVIHSTNERNNLDDDRSVILGSLGGGSRRMMEEESKAHYMDMDGNHVSTDYQTMKSLTYENNILSAGTTHVGSLGDTAGERVAGGTHYVDMSGKNGVNDYEAMKSITYDNL